MVGPHRGPEGRFRRRRVWAAVGVLAAGGTAAALAGGTLAAGSATPIRIGILSTCQGPFAPFYPETTAGARTASISLPVRLTDHGPSNSQLPRMIQATSGPLL